MEFGSLLMLEQ